MSDELFQCQLEMSNVNTCKGSTTKTVLGWHYFGRILMQLDFQFKILFCLQPPKKVTNTSDSFHNLFVCIESKYNSK